MSKAVRFILPILIAMMLGPLIAGFVVSLLTLAVGVYDSGVASLGTAVLELFAIYIVLAYAVGAPVAFLAGLMVSLWMLARAPSLLVVVAAAALATAIYMGIGASGLLGPVEYTDARSNFLVTTTLAVIAAAGCWLLTGRFARAA